MGKVYYDLTESDQPIRLQSNMDVLIKPGHRVVLITEEQVAIPDDHVAHVVSKGSFFSLGLSAVATMADPGFCGNLGIVTQNVSDSYIIIPVGEPIAKIEFVKLTRSSTKPYVGQHGFQTQIWPIKHHLKKTYRQVQGDSRVESERVEALRLLPDATVKILSRMEARQQWVDFAIVGALLINAISLIAISKNWFDTGMAIGVNLIADVIVAAWIYLSRLYR
jgi:dCTP deaminase